MVCKDEVVATVNCNPKSDAEGAAAVNAEQRGIDNARQEVKRTKKAHKVAKKHLKHLMQTEYGRTVTAQDHVEKWFRARGLESHTAPIHMEVI